METQATTTAPPPPLEGGVATDEGEEPKRRTLSELLAALNQADEAMEDLDLPPTETIITDLGEKVDSYKYVLDKIDGEIDRISNMIAGFQATKKTLQNKKERLRSLMAYNMDQQGFRKLPGQSWQATLTKKQALVVRPIAEPDSRLFAKYPEVIDRKYSWKKRELAKYIESHPESDLAPMGQQETRLSVTFRPKKGVDDDK